MRRQLQRIKELSWRPEITIQILPFSAGAHPHMGGAFTILEFSDENLDDLLYLENVGDERTFREVPDVLADYQSAFTALEEMATKPGELVDVLESIEAQRFKEVADPLARSPPPEPDR